MIEEREYSEGIQELLSTIQEGEACYSFFNTHIGRYLLEQSSQEEEEAFKEWLEIDATDAKAIRACQHKAQIPKLVFAWLRDAVTKAADANQLIAEELEEMSDER
jgi:hypothetical protein